MRQETELRHSHINTQHIAATPPTVIPVHTGNHLSAHEDAAFGNTLATADNKSNDNTVAIPTYYTRYTMGPRVREDDEIREKKQGTKASKRQKWRVATKETENLEPHSSKQTLLCFLFTMDQMNLLRLLRNTLNKRQ